MYTYAHTHVQGHASYAERYAGIRMHAKNTMRLVHIDLYESTGFSDGVTGYVLLGSHDWR